MPELLNNQPHHPPKQIHIKDHTGQIEATSREDHCWRKGRLQSRKEHHRADLQPENPLWEISPAPARPLPCPQRLQGLDRFGHAASWATMKKDDISASLIQVIKLVTNSWNRGQLLLILSKTIQENALQENKRYWTDGQNISLSSTITRPMEIQQY